MSDNKHMLPVEEIEASLCTFLKSNIVDSTIEFDAHTSFNALHIDSLSIVEMVLFLERKYRISIPEAELNPENFKSVRTLAACAHRCLQHG